MSRGESLPRERSECCGYDMGAKAQRVFNIDIETCGHCGGAVKVIACIEDQATIDRILDHLRRKEQDTPVRPLLAPPTRAPPGTR